MPVSPDCFLRWMKVKGDYSVAMGHSIATGNFSTALGFSKASGLHSTALGYSIASNNAATAMGQSTASGNNATAMGGSNALGDFSTAAGYFSYAYGRNSVAMGHYSNASGDNSTAIGESIAGGTYSTSMGYKSNAAGSISTATGESVASGDHSTAMGKSTAFGQYSTSAGQGTASGNLSTALGSGVASGDYSTAVGTNTRASGTNAISIGDNTIAKAGFETVLGTYNTDYNPASTTGWNPSDRLFTVGNGTNSKAASDAVVILKNGNMGIGTSVPDARLSIAENSSMPQLKLFQGTGTDYVRLRLSTINSNINNRSWDIAANIDAGAATADRLNFYHNSAGNILSLRGNGNIGIGTVNSNASLQFANTLATEK